MFWSFRDPKQHLIHIDHSRKHPQPLGLEPVLLHGPWEGGKVGGKVGGKGPLGRKPQGWHTSIAPEKLSSQ